MQESDKRHFAQMLEALSVGGLKADVTQAMLKVYWMGLSDLPVEDFDKGIGRALQECEFFPPVAKLRELAGHKRRVPEPHYLRPVEDELERIETCQFHVKNPPTERAPEAVSWCRKCRRLRLAANGKGQPQALGELLQAAALAPLDPEGERK